MNLKAANVLVLNSVWLPIGITSYQKSLICLCSESNGQLAAQALDIQYKQLDENTFDFNEVVSIRPVAFDEWITLPLRPYDAIVKTVKHSVRLPSVIVAMGFHKMPLRQIKATKRAIFERDGYICQYSGVRLPKNQLSVDHIVPKSKSGRDDWLNLVTCSKEINTKKGNKTNDEAGLALIKKPTKPLPQPASTLIREIRNVDWKIFLHK